MAPIFFLILVIVQSIDCLSFGNITAESVVIFEAFYYHNGSVDAIADRTERISTDEDISAIRGIDVSGQNGDATVSYFSSRSVEIVFWSDGVGKGFNFSVEVYANRKMADGGAVSRSVSAMLIGISMAIGLGCFGIL